MKERGKAHCNLYYYLCSIFYLQVIYVFETHISILKYIDKKLIFKKKESFPLQPP